MAHWHIDVRRRQDRILVAFAIVFAGLVLGSFFNRGPKFQGKPAKFWAKELIRSPQPATAAKALFYLGPDVSVPPLIQTLQAEGLPAYRYLWPKLPAFLRTRLPNPLVVLNNRYRAAQVLGGFGIGAQPAIPYLVKALRSSNRELRSAAAVALGEIGPEARNAVPLLEGMAKDADTHVKRDAEVALKKISGGDSTNLTTHRWSVQ
jgi:hypothetical protein